MSEQFDTQIQAKSDEMVKSKLERLAQEYGQDSSKTLRQLVNQEDAIHSLNQLPEEFWEIAKTLWICKKLFETHPDNTIELEDATIHQKEIEAAFLETKAIVESIQREYYREWEPDWDAGKCPVRGCEVGKSKSRSTEEDSLSRQIQEINYGPLSKHIALKSDEKHREFRDTMELKKPSEIRKWLVAERKRVKILKEYYGDVFAPESEV